jgi:hypothetical protein
VSQPTAYDRQASFTTIQQEFPTDPLPGDDLDAELNAVKQTLDEILNNLALIQRDDGALANESVGLDQLSSDIELGYRAPSIWAAATEYDAFDAVFYAQKFYNCLEAHTSSGAFSTDLADLKWEVIADFTQLGDYWRATSTTSQAITSGVKSFTIEADRFFVVGDYVQIAVDDENYMTGHVTAYSGTSITVNVDHYEGSGTHATWDFHITGHVGPQGDVGETGATGDTGATGSPGPTPALVWEFSGSTADSDPGSGIVRFNHGTFASITEIYFDNEEEGGTDVSAWLDTFDDSTSTIKGTLTCIKVTDSTVFGVFHVTGSVVDGTGYRKVTVTPLAGAVPSNTNELAFTFSRAGEPGGTEEAQDAVGTILSDTDTIAWTYDDGTPTIEADVTTQMSITSDASGVKLSGDSASPGNYKSYGTDSGGTKGWQPAAGMVFLIGGTFSAVSALDIILTGGLNSYRAIKVVLTDVSCSASENIHMLCSTNGGSSFDSGSEYAYAVNYTNSAAGYAAIGTTDSSDTEIYIGFAISGGVYNGAFEVTAYHLDDAATTPQFVISGVGTSDSGNPWSVFGVGSYYGGVDVDALRFFPGSGTFTGTYAVYGVR